MSEQVQLWETYNDKGFKAKLSEFAEKDAAGNDIATSMGNRYTKGETDNLLNGKEDKIDDLDTIRSNASKGATAIQGVQRNGTDLIPDANSKVNVEVPVLGIQVNNADVTPDQSTKKVNLTVLDTISAGSDYPVSSKTIYTALDDIYTKAETNAVIAAAVADFGGFKVVPLGPDGKPAEQSPSTKIIYLTKDDPATKVDPYTEWICTDTTGPVWEIIGETSVDLSQYYTKTEADALLANKVTVVLGKGLSTEDYTTPEKTKLAGISDGANKVEPSQTNGNIKVDGTETTVYAHPAGSENVSGLYKVATDSTGHVTSATAVVKADITDLGIPAQDTTYESKTAAQGGTDVSLVTTGEKYTWNQKYDRPVNGIPKNELAQEVQDSLDAADTALQPADIDGYWNGAVIDSGSGNVVSGVSVDSSTGRVTVAKTSIVPSDSTPLVASGNGDAGTDTEYARADHVHPSDSTKADKVSGATSGNFAALDSNGNLIDSTKQASDFKTVQTAVADPTASGTAVSFIDTISQDANGEITVTKKTVQNATASTSGVGGNAGLLSAADKETIDNLATVATTGNYSDLNGTPTIPAAANDGELSITIGNTTTTFTANQSNNASVSIVNATYDDTATPTTYTAGLMTGEDKETLDNLATVAANKADKVSGAHSGNFAGLDNTGNLTDSGSNASSFATAAQGAKADTAYQLPANGIPETDLESAVQASLGLADTAYQLPPNGIPSTDLESSVQASLGLADTAVQPATLNDYVQKETGKGLSTNDYTQTDKDIVDQVGDAIPQDADSANPLVTSTVLQQAIANFGGFEVVSLDPKTHEPDVQSPSNKIIYMTKDSQSTATDPYTEWIYQNSSWEIVGETSVDLTGYIQSVSMAGGTAISPISGSTTIDLPAATNNSGTVTAGIMSGPDKVKLDGIAPGAEVNSIATISLNGTGLTPDANRNVDITVTSPTPSDANPAMDGTAVAGVSSDYSRADHVHPSDTNKQDVLTFNTAYDPSSNKAATMSDVTGAVASKADVVSGATSGNLAALDGNGNLVDSQVSPSDFKTVQTAVVDPTASGNTVSFIDTISQNTNGEISVTKKTVSDAVASSSGVGGSAGLLSAADKETIDSLVTVATTGDYNDLTNKPTIPAAQVNSDWDASSGVAEILHKPTIGDGTLSITVGSASAQTFTANQETSESVIIPLADVDTSGATPVYTEGLMSASDKEKLDGIEAGAEANVKPDWNATDGADNEILNKPTIGNGTLSITVGSAAAQTFTANQETNESITIPLAAVDNTGSTPVYTEGLMSAADKAKVEGIAEKADKVTSATPNNFASLTSGGNLADSGYSANSFATAAQGALADSSIQGVTVDNGSPLTPVSGVVNIDLSGKVDKVTGKGLSTNDYTDADKAIVGKAYDVIPGDATYSNKLVSYDTMTAALANFIGMKISTGTGIDMHPDEQNPNTKTIYLVLDSSATGNDKYKEWIYSTTNTWTLIGDTTVDLSGYVQYPATHTDTHLVAFGPNESIADTGKTVADLTNSVETVSIGSGSGISPTSGTTDINIPLATNVNNVGTDGAMAGADKVKLDGIAPGAQVNTVNTVSIGNGSGIAPTTGTTDINIPMATSSVDGAMSSADKGKLDGITAGAEPNVQSSWTEADSTSDAYIANKPDIIIPLASPSTQGGISAPKYLMVVTTMPPAAQIDPDTIYLVQGTYIGT